MANRTKRTPEKEAELFTAVKKHGGNVTAACEEVGLGRTTVFEWSTDDPAFKAQLDVAIDQGADVLEDECRRRAFAGTDEPVFYQGSECGAVRKYSDTLAIFLLKGIRPEKYRERLGVDFTSASDEQIEKAILSMPDDKLRGLIARIRT